MAKLKLVNTGSFDLSSHQIHDLALDDVEAVALQRGGFMLAVGDPEHRAQALVTHDQAEAILRWVADTLGFRIVPPPWHISNARKTSAPRISSTQSRDDF